MAEHTVDAEGMERALEFLASEFPGAGTIVGAELQRSSNGHRHPVYYTAFMMHTDGSSADMAEEQRNAAPRAWARKDTPEAAAVAAAEHYREAAAEYVSPQQTKE